MRSTTANELKSEKAEFLPLLWLSFRFSVFPIWGGHFSILPPTPIWWLFLFWVTYLVKLHKSRVQYTTGYKKAKRKQDKQSLTCSYLIVFKLREERITVFILNKLKISDDVHIILCTNLSIITFPLTTILFE